METEVDNESANPNRMPASIVPNGFQLPKIIAAKPMTPFHAVSPSSNRPTEPREK